MTAYRRVLGFTTHITCMLTAKNWDQLRNTTLGNRVWASFTFSFLTRTARGHWPHQPVSVTLCSQLKVQAFCNSSWINTSYASPRASRHRNKQAPITAIRAYQTAWITQHNVSSATNNHADDLPNIKTTTFSGCLIGTFFSSYFIYAVLGTQNICSFTENFDCRI